MTQKLKMHKIFEVLEWAMEIVDVKLYIFLPYNEGRHHFELLKIFMRNFSICQFHFIMDLSHIS